ncbi:unnamed protein product [Laminaria digitata]
MDSFRGGGRQDWDRPRGRDRQHHGGRRRGGQRSERNGEGSSYDDRHDDRRDMNAGSSPSSGSRSSRAVPAYGNAYSDRETVAPFPEDRRSRRDGRERDRGRERRDNSRDDRGGQR